MSTARAVHFREHGYVVVPEVISSTDLPLLRDAAERVTARTRAGEWPHRRVVGKQFPPWTEEGMHDVWGVQHLMHPSLGEPAFREWYCSEPLLAVCRELIACTQDHLQMELFNLLVLPQSTSFSLCWHRDHIKPEATPDEEAEALTIPHYGVQWNTALCDDSCLWIVPGSHRTVRTPEQRALSWSNIPTSDPPSSMPGAMQVHLKGTSGDTVFMDANIIHLASYPQSPPHPPRLTLHACIGDARGGSARAVGILQHGLAWMRDEKGFGLSGPGVEMWRKLVEIEKSARETGEEGKFSQEG